MALRFVRDWQNNIPITYKGKPLCIVELILHRISNKFDNPQIRSRYNSVLLEMTRTDLFRKRIECLIESYNPEINFRDTMWAYFRFAYDNLNSLTCLKHVESDDEIINIIKNHGPISLCNSIVQDGLNEWINNKNIAHLKLKKVLDALLEYAYGSKYRDILFKQGRPEIEAKRLYDDKTTKIIYKSLIEILKLAKLLIKGGLGRGIKDDKSKVKKIIDGSYYAFMKIKIEFFDHKNDKISKNKYYSAKYWSDSLKLNPISSCINRDDSMILKFLSAKYEPNKLAKELLLKMLNISERKLTYILYKQAE